MKFPKAVLWLLLVLCSPVLKGQVLINEFSCSNLHYFQNGFGDYDDFVELYNYTDSVVDLSGYYLSDRFTNPMKWAIPAGVTIQPGGYAVFITSGKLTTQWDGQYWHTTYNTTQTSHEDVVLSDPLGIILDHYWIEETTQMNHSRGRLFDGSPDWGVMVAPTPGAANVNVYDGYTKTPVMDTLPGFYTGSLTVSIAYPDTIDAVIRYTTNGTKPDNNSAIYTGPITINNTTTLRARAFPVSGGGGSGSTTFCDQNQGGPGFPGNPGCEAAVCADDPFCCNNTWDNICGSIAATTPQCLLCLSDANAVYCDEAQGSAGFPMHPPCQSAVCAGDAFCCNNSWDNICASAAAFEPACNECASDYVPVGGGGGNTALNLFPGFTETNTFFIDETFSFKTIALSGQLGQWNAGGGGGWMNVNGTWHSHYEVCLELFDENGVFVTELEGTLRRHGNDSWAYPQRGLRFHSRDQQGFNNNIEHQLFELKPRSKFDVLIMKAAGSDNYPGNGWLPTAHLRDGYAQTAAQLADTELDVRTYDHQITFLNGQYWGVYEMRERIDKDYTDYYYDQPEQFVDMLEYWGGLTVEYGSSADWYSLHNFVTNNDMSVQLNYDYVATQLDPESFIDNFIVNTYFVNTDWLNWNTKWWRGNFGTGVRWRYALWDLDNTFNLGQNYTGWSSTGPYVNTVCEAQSMFQNWSAANGHTAMYSALLDNEAFFMQYLNRYADLLNTGLHCDTLVALLDDFEARMIPEMPRQFQRWGGNMGQWQNRIQNIRDFVCLRWNIVMQQIIDCFEDDYDISGPYDVTVVIIGPGDVQLNTITIPAGPWTGSYFGGLDLGLNALPEANAEFIQWELNNNFVGQNLLDPSLLLTLNSNDTIFAYFEWLENPLPVEWLSFEGEVVSSYGELRWATASEQNTSHFEVQRAEDAVQFETIGSVAAAGFSSSVMQYNFTDRDGLEGIHYYRIKQVDLDGQYDYSNVIALDYGKGASALLFAPNPNNGQFYVVNTSEEIVNATVLSPHGQEIIELSLAPNQQTDVQLENRSSGIYLIRYYLGGKQYHQKMAVH